MVQWKERQEWLFKRQGVQVIPRELFLERIEEQIVGILVLPIAEEIAEVVQIIPLERFQQSTAEQIGRRSCATALNCCQLYSACSSDRRRNARTCCYLCNTSSSDRARGAFTGG